ncbi:hypothetical protein E2C01_071424 [Portunus trituberculatus]|uniref:Uncharacterized protein n=1 Tax=Portunus trituberculatus TaxID=210409 RepID=A0A5B7I671_PORTR|nr:hypothetical protein [Portunus trituberculatus]
MCCAVLWPCCATVRYILRRWTPIIQSAFPAGQYAPSGCPTLSNFAPPRPFPVVTKRATLPHCMTLVTTVRPSRERPPL